MLRGRVYRSQKLGLALEAEHGYPAAFGALQVDMVQSRGSSGHSTKTRCRFKHFGVHLERQPNY